MTKDNNIEAMIGLTDGTVTDTLLQMDGSDISLPDISRSTLAQLTDDQFVTLLVKVYTSRGTQYMNQHISKIAWRINQLPIDKVSAYIFQIMQSYPINIEGLRTLVNRTPIHTLCSDRGVAPSLALFIGFGHNGSNEGIVEIVNNAFPQIMNSGEKRPANSEEGASKTKAIGEKRPANSEEGASTPDGPKKKKSKNETTAQNILDPTIKKGKTLSSAVGNDNNKAKRSRRKKSGELFELNICHM